MAGLTVQMNVSNVSSSPSMTQTDSSLSTHSANSARSPSSQQRSPISMSPSGSSFHDNNHFIADETPVYQAGVKKARKTLCNGRFLVLTTLGAGATGKVKLGFDKLTNNYVALKLMEYKVESHRQLGQIDREIRAMKLVSHKHVLGLKHVELACDYPKANGTVKKCILLVIELAPGGELFEYMMHTGPFHENLFKVYARQLLRGLQACHERGVYHRDLKPENLLLDEKFQLKMADFGYCAIQENVVDREGKRSNNLLHTECGTRSYMAPEILVHQPYSGATVDVWSAGVVMFIMLTGAPPMQIAATNDWWFNCLVYGHTDRFWRAHMRGWEGKELSVESRRFIERMLTPNPVERATVEELLNDAWLNQGEFDEHVVLMEMTERKRRIDLKKMEEKMLANKMHGRANGNVVSDGSHDNMLFDATPVVNRSVGKHADDMPPIMAPYSKPASRTVYLPLVLNEHVKEKVGNELSNDEVREKAVSIHDEIKNMAYFKGWNFKLDLEKGKIKFDNKDLVESGNNDDVLLEESFNLDDNDESTRNLNGTEYAFSSILIKVHDDMSHFNLLRRGGSIIEFQRISDMIKKQLIGSEESIMEEKVKELMSKGDGKPIEMI